MSSRAPLALPNKRPVIRTHYIGHDKEYQKRRAAGSAGWDTEEGVRETITGLERLVVSTGFPRSGTVLEMGCGAGDQSLWLAAQGYAVTGVDIAPTAIAWAQEKAQERGLAVDFRVGDVLRLADFADAEFDVVLDGHCLHCIIGADRAEFLAAARRMLKPGGVLHVATMYGDPVPESAKTNFDPATRCTIFGDIATRYFGRPEDIVAEVTGAGFGINELRESPSTGPGHQHMLYINARR